MVCLDFKGMSTLKSLNIRSKKEKKMNCPFRLFETNKNIQCLKVAFDNMNRNKKSEERSLREAVDLDREHTCHSSEPKVILDLECVC